MNNVKYANIPALSHHTPDIDDAQLLLEIFGEQRASAAVSIHAVGHDEDQRTSAALHKLPAQHTAFTVTCPRRPRSNLHQQLIQFTTDGPKRTNTPVTVKGNGA